LRERAGDGLLEALADLAGDGGVAVAKAGREGGERRAEPGAAFVEDQAALEGGGLAIGPALALAGRKPKKAKRSVGRPARVRAATTALGPGMVVTAIPAARASRTSL